MPAVLPFIEAAATIYSIVQANNQQRQAQQALNAPPKLTAEQKALADQLRTTAQQYLAPNYAQNFADQFAASQQAAIDQAAQQAAERSLAHLAALGRSTGGAYNAVNADLAKQTADLLAQAHAQGLQLGQQRVDNATAALDALANRDFEAARQRQMALAELAGQGAQNYGSLAGSTLGLLANRYGLNPYNTAGTSGAQAGGSSFLLNGTPTTEDVLRARRTVPSINFGGFKLSS